MPFCAASHCRRLFVAVTLLICNATTPLLAEHVVTADVVIYGGTSAGIAAAIQVARQGKRAVLIEPTTHLGGLTTSGLGFTDSGDKRVVGGLAREFYQRIKRHYDREDAWRFERADQYARYRRDADAMWTFEPHVASEVFRAWLAETDVTVVLQQPLDRKLGVQREGNRIVSVATRGGTIYVAKMFIDATYEGDLMAAAGVSYVVGREGNSVYGETLNGSQPLENKYNHRFLQSVDPYRIPGDVTSGLVAGIQSQGVAPVGTGDQRIQAYCFRMCMTKLAANRVPFPKSADYDESEYELLLRAMEAGDLRLPFSPDMMPNGKTDTNNLGAMSTDYIGMNYDYPEADDARRAEIVAQHRNYQQGLMWTLANHPRVPQQVRQAMEPWGLAADEFIDNDHWPPMLYIRESRRMVSDYVMTEHDCRRQRIVTDSVGLGSYNMDSHNVQRYVTANGHVQNEGDVQVSPGGAYLISYRSIVPRRDEVGNLAVPVCLAASHIAYGSIRMEPVFMVLGQSAATAACLAIDDELLLVELPYERLRLQLLKDQQVLELPTGQGNEGGNG
ncbi:MAG: FAD-dependent oxidoreductase [Planctomycetales bacterium]|nr:FAD-dependent oxidoreductase [Planctomycetales bacterium]